MWHGDSEWVSDIILPISGQCQVSVASTCFIADQRLVKNLRHGGAENASRKIKSRTLFGWIRFDFCCCCCTWHVQRIDCSVLQNQLWKGAELVNGGRKLKKSKLCFSFPLLAAAAAAASLYSLSSSPRRETCFRRSWEFISSFVSLDEK